MKYILSRESAFPKDKLICKKINAKGEETLIQDNEVLYDIIDRFVAKDYEIVIAGNDLYLSRNNITFVMYDFRNVIDCRHLTTLKKSIISKIPEDQLMVNISQNVASVSQNEEDLNKGIIKAVTGAAAVFLCTISLISFFQLDADKSSDNDKDVDHSKDVKKITASQVSKTPYWSTLNVFNVGGKQFTLTKNHSAFDDIIALCPEKEEELVEESEVTFEEKSHAVRQKYYLTRDMLDTLLLDMCNGTMADVAFNSTDEALDYLYETDERTYPEKMLIVMVRENLTYDQLDDICAGTIAEGGEYYDETYRVASVGYNRYRSKTFTSCYGEGLYTQFLAPHQFSVFHDKMPYLKFKGWIDSPGYQGAIDMFFTRQRTIDYVAFRSHKSKVPSDWVCYRSNGNRFGMHQEYSDILKLDYEYVFEEEMAEDLALAEEENLTRELKS